MNEVMFCDQQKNAKVFHEVGTETYTRKPTPIYISCTYYSGWLKYNSQLVGPRGWGGRAETTKFGCNLLDGNRVGFNV
jgi:hypothetical protein